MAWLRNLSVSRKFLYAFGTVCGLCVLLGCFTFLTFRSVSTNTTDVSANAFPSVVHLADARGAMDVLRREDLDLMLCQTPACTSAHIAQRRQAIADYQDNIRAYEASIDYPD